MCYRSVTLSTWHGASGKGQNHSDELVCPALHTCYALVRAVGDALLNNLECRLPANWAIEVQMKWFKTPNDVLRNWPVHEAWSFIFSALSWNETLCWIKAIGCY